MSGVIAIDEGVDGVDGVFGVDIPLNLANPFERGVAHLEVPDFDPFLLGSVQAPLPYKAIVCLYIYCFYNPRRAACSRLKDLSAFVSSTLGIKKVSALPEILETHRQYVSETCTGLIIFIYLVQGPLCAER